MDVLKGFFQKHGWRYLPGMAFLILNAALDVVPARLLGDAVDLMRESVIDQGAVLRKLILLIPLIFILPHYMPDKVFAVFLAEPVSDIIAAAVTSIAFFTRFNKILAGAPKSNTQPM